MKNLALLTALIWISSAPLAAQVQSPQNPEEKALMKYAFDGKLEDVRRLVSKGIPVDAADQAQRTPLMWAAFNGHTSVVRFLQDKGANLGARDSNGRTALIYASSGASPETVEFLLKKGAEVNVQGKLEGFTALMTAAAEGQVEVVRLLLAYGAAADIKDTDGDTAESFARRKGHAAVIDLLQQLPVPKVKP